MTNPYAPEVCHERLMKNAPLRLAYRPEVDFDSWREEVGATLRELLGLEPERVPPNLRIEYEADTDLFHEVRFVFTSEPSVQVPCHLLTPKSGSGPFPVVICVQGHTTGMHVSLGRIKFDGDPESIHKGEHDYAIQAVKEGYAALVLEQRCFGERHDDRPDEVRFVRRACRHASLVALILGRTMIGERVWDISRAIDLLESFSDLDVERIGLMGQSGGGTTTYFATCMEPRIKIAMPACYVCTFVDSIGKIDHCCCNYVPRILEYFEMGDMAGLIAPRPLVVVAGRNDPIFPFEAVERTFETIQRIYARAGAADRCRFVVAEGDHRFYPSISWPVFRELSGW